MHLIQRALPFLAAGLIAGCAVQGPRTAASDPKSALAPVGKLRVGLFLGTPTNAVKDPATGELKGIGHDLGSAFATRAGLPFVPVLYTDVNDFTNGGDAGQWDVAFLAISEERSKLFDFTTPYLQIEFAYVVPGGSPLTGAAEADRKGVRIAAVENGSPEGHLRRTLRNAQLIKVKTLPNAIELVKSGGADAVYGVKANVGGMTAGLPGSRVLPGDAGAEQHAIALPKGKSSTARASAQGFVDEAKANGTVKGAIDRANLRTASIPAR
jgi:polar amino acid transport system substrate-binding protein